MGITTTIPTNLDFPNRGVLERDAFVNAQETAQDLLAGAYTTALNQYATELNSTQADINLKAEQVASQAVDGGYSQTYINTTFTPKILNTQTDKATPVDADLIPLSDSAASFGLKKLSWLNIKNTLKTYFDTLYTIASSETVSGIIELATTAEAQTGTDDSRAITPLKLRNALNASGTAPIYASRAWVNFSGTGTVAIRASGNVSSITDGGVGTYAINFATSMPDANYSLCWANDTESDAISNFSSSNAASRQIGIISSLKTVSSVPIYSGVNQASFASQRLDFREINVSFFR